MKTRVAIYGFNRLGRAVFALTAKRRDIEVVALYSQASPEKTLEMLEKDSIYEPIEQEYKVDGDAVLVGDQEVVVIEKSSNRMWQDYEVDVVIDCLSSKVTNALGNKHLEAGANRVVFAGIGPVAATIILGVNEELLTSEARTLSCGGPVATAVEPVSEVLRTACAAEVVIPRSFAGRLSCCQDKDCDCKPNTKDKEEPIGDVLVAPEMTAGVSVVTALVGELTTPAKINAAFKKAAKEPYYQGIIAVTDEIDEPDTVIGESVSALIDLSATKVDGKLVSIVVWYDREWAYANRIVEVMADFGKAVSNARRQ